MVDRNTGKNNPNFKHGKCCVPNYCIDCLKKGIKTKINYRSKRCQSHAVRYLYKIKKFDFNGNKNGMFGKKASKKTKKKMSLSHGGTGIPRKEMKFYCIDCDKEIHYDTWYRGTKRCPSCSVIKQHKDGIFNYNRKPNNPEKQLIKLLNKSLPKEYKYVGNDKIIIDSFNPDFINCNGQKKIIELYGDYWHNRKEVKNRDQRRLIAYKKYGYKILIVWEHELKNLNKVKNKISIFNKESKYGRP